MNFVSSLCSQGSPFSFVFLKEMFVLMWKFRHFGQFLQVADTKITLSEHRQVAMSFGLFLLSVVRFMVILLFEKGGSLIFFLPLKLEFSVVVTCSPQVRDWDWLNMTTWVCTLRGYVHYMGMYTTWVCTLCGYVHYVGMYTTWVCTLHGYVHYMGMYTGASYNTEMLKNSLFLIPGQKVKFKRKNWFWVTVAIII